MTARHVWAVGLVVVTSSACAFAASPLDASTATPPLGYASAFANYRPYSDLEAGNWRGLNETVKAVGGHMGAMARQSSPQTPNGAAPTEKNPAAGPVKSPTPTASKEQR